MPFLLRRWIGRGVLVVSGAFPVLVGGLLLSSSPVLRAQQDPPSSPPLAVSDIQFFDQAQKAVFVMGQVHETGTLELFLMPVYEVATGDLLTFRLIRREDGDLQQVVGSGRADRSRLAALLNTGQVFFFDVTPPSQQPAPLEEVSSPREIYPEMGIERLAATDDHIALQRDTNELILLRTADLEEVHRETFSHPITALAFSQDRLLVVSPPLAQVLGADGTRLAEWELAATPLAARGDPQGFVLQQDATRVLVYDRGGNLTGEIRTDHPIEALAVTQAGETLGVLSGDGLLLLDRKGQKRGEISGGPFEHLGASFRSFFVHRGQEIAVVDVLTGTVVRAITLRNQLENLVGFPQGLSIVVREREGERRLIYAFYDEQGTLYAVGLLLTLEGDRP